MSWIENPRVVTRLGKLWRCTVAGEREKDEETQARTDEQRQKLMKRLGELVPEVTLWTPPAGVKDLGEMLSSAATLDSIGTKNRP